MGLDMDKTLRYTGAEWRSILDREDDSRFQKKNEKKIMKSLFIEPWSPETVGIIGTFLPATPAEL